VAAKPEAEAEQSAISLSNQLLERQVKELQYQMKQMRRNTDRARPRPRRKALQQSLQRSEKKAMK